MAQKNQNHEHDQTEQPLEIHKDVIDLQKSQLRIKESEIQADARHSENQKELALAVIQAERDDRKESREAL